MRARLHKPLEMAGYTLVAVAQGVETQYWPLSLGKVHTVGRAGCGADIGVEDELVSAMHCTICIEKKPRQGVMLTVSDMHSPGGTYINGQQMQKGSTSSAMYNPGQTLWLGECQSELKINGGEPDFGGELDAGLSQAIQDGAANNEMDNALQDGVAIDAADQSSGAGEDAKVEPVSKEIAFDYSQETNSRNKWRSRSPRQSMQQSKLDQRQQAREKKKLLWSKPAGGSLQNNDKGIEKTTPTNALAKGNSSADGLTPAPGSFSSFNQWESSSFSSADDKAKFLRLMGAGEHAETSGDCAQPEYSAQQSHFSDTDYGYNQQQGQQSEFSVANYGYSQQQELEQQYWQSVRRGRGRGLGW